MYSNKVKNITGVDKVPAELQDNEILVNSTNEDIDLNNGQAIGQGEWSHDLDNILSDLSPEFQMSVLGVYKVTDSRFFGENYRPIFVEFHDYITPCLLSLGYRTTGFKQVVSDKIDQLFEMLAGGTLTQQELNEVKTDILACVCDTPFGFCPLYPTSVEYYLSTYFTRFFYDKDIAVVNRYVPYEVVMYNGMECLDTLLKYDADPYSEKTYLFNSLIYVLQCVNLICIYYNNVCYCIFYGCNQINVQSLDNHLNKF